MKRATLAFVLLASAMFFAPGLGAHRGAAVAATPTPAALQYDEINRVIIPPASPPPPGSWRADYQVVMAAPGAATPAPQKHGLGGLLNAVMGGPEQAMNAAAAGMNQMRNGHLVRYTYYKGWIRTDDPVAQTATIEKCDRHQFVTLDLAKKTYTIASTQPPCPTSPMGPMGRAHGGAPGHETPGTADMTFKTTAANLGPLAIDGIGTNGADNTLEMKIANATGSCKNGDIKMNVMQYVSTVTVPRPYCPLPRSPGPAEMMQMHGGGGCTPTMHTQLAGGMNPFDAAHLVMYRRMSFAGGGGDQGDSSDQDAMARQMAAINMVTERGDVRWFSGAEADALFTIPPGFTQQS